MDNIRNLNTAMGLYGRRESLAYKVITPFYGRRRCMNTKTLLFLTSIFCREYRRPEVPKPEVDRWKVVV